MMLQDFIEALDLYGVKGRVNTSHPDYKVVIIAGAGNVKYVFIPSEVVYDHEAKIVVIRTIYGKPELIQ